MSSYEFRISLLISEENVFWDLIRNTLNTDKFRAIYISTFEFSNNKHDTSSPFI